MDLSPVFLNVYSNPPTGKLELSSSVGINGLQPLMETSIGISLSSSFIFPNGNFVSKVAFSNRGNPYDFSPAPFPVFGFPKTFQAGTGPSRTLAPFSSPFTESAAIINGSLKTSG